MRTSKRAAGVLLVVFVIASVAVMDVGASPGAPESQTVQLAAEGPRILLRWDPAVSNSRVSPPREFSQLRAQSATFTVNYLANGTTDRWGENCYAWPDDAKAAFNYATSIWASLINSPVPISINACWAVLPSEYLGYSGARWDPRIDTQYPMALSNALSGTDQNGATAEMDVGYNSIYAWYYGTDGNTPGDEVDFASVVLHEIAHGLGFAGSMTKEGALGYWNWRNGEGPPAIYDRFTEEGAGGTGTPLIDYDYGSEQLGSALTSEDVFFDGANANAANGGSPPKLYAPATWRPGSSYSHLDYDTFDSDTENCLMVYAMSAGESVHDPGPIALGILKDVGWTTGEADLSIVKQVDNGAWGCEPGDLVTFTLSIENIGEDTATGVVVTDTLSSDILTPTFDSSLSVTPTGVISYVWSLPDLAFGESGVITVYGTISGSLSPDFAIWNTASVGTSSLESETINNSSTVLIGGWRIYLPLVIRNY